MIPDQNKALPIAVRRVLRRRFKSLGAALSLPGAARSYFRPGQPLASQEHLECVSIKSSLF